MLAPRGGSLVSQGVSTRSRRASHPKSAITKQRILDAAARAFSLNGYAGTTINDIAMTAGMQGGSIYYYFESKDDILQEVLDVGITRVFSAARLAIGSLPASSAFSEKLEAAVTAHLTMLLQQGDYTSANIRVFEQAPPAVKRQNRKLRAAYGEYWGQLLSEGQRSGAIRKNVDLTILRLMILGSMNWAVTWYRSDRMPIPELARKFCEVVLKGVGLSDDQPESSSRGRRARS